MEGEELNIDNEEIVAGPFSGGVRDEISFEKSGTGPIEPPFLDASTHLYQRLCPSIRPSVRPSVRRSVRPSVRWSVGP